MRTPFTNVAACTGTISGVATPAQWLSLVPLTIADVKPNPWVRLSRSHLWNQLQSPCSFE